MEYESMSSNNESKITNLCNFTPEQISFINELTLPKKIERFCDSQFDTPFIQTNGELWNFIYGGINEKFSFKFLNPIVEKLVKYLIVVLAQRSQFPGRIQFDFIKNLMKMECDIEVYIYYLNSLAIDSSSRIKSVEYFTIKAISRLLCQMDFPRFPPEKIEALNFLPTPNIENNWLKYQDTENAFPAPLKNLIARSIVSISKTINKFDKEQLRDYALIGLSYYTGMRPAQFSKLAVKDINIDSRSNTTGLTRYSISVPYAKKQQIMASRFTISIPNELGDIILSYISEAKLGNEEQLFFFPVGIRLGLKNAINKSLFNFQPLDVQKAIKTGDIIPPYYTSYDMRHNVGHSMALAGASADEIAYVLGHSSIIAATFYVMATPELSMVKNKALGENPIWQNMVGLLITGYVADEHQWSGKTVSGVVADKLFVKVGGCDRPSEQCHLAKVRSCYGCFFFRPFRNVKKHKDVLTAVNQELLDTLEISEKSGNSKNPAINVLINTKAELQIVIGRIQYGAK